MNEWMILVEENECHALPKWATSGFKLKPKEPLETVLTAMSCSAICFKVIVGCLERFGCNREGAAGRGLPDAATAESAAPGAELEATVGNMYDRRR